jgi:hypothetical protein
MRTSLLSHGPAELPEVVEGLAGDDVPNKVKY